MEKEKQKNNKFLVVLVLLLLVGVSIGYAVISRDYIFSGIINVNSNKWEITIPEDVPITVEPTDGPKPNVTVDDDGNVVISYGITLENPGDTYSFIVPIENKGSLDAQLSNVKQEKVLTSRQQEFLEYKIEELKSDGTTVALTNQRLAAESGKINVKVTVTYKEDKDALPTDAETSNGVANNIQLKTVLTFSQAS